MIIVYYRRMLSGEIYQAHENRNKKTLEELEADAEAFNKSQSHCVNKAFVVDVPEESLEWYLFSSKKEWVSKQKEILEDVAESLESAANEIFGVVNGHYQ